MSDRYQLKSHTIGVERKYSNLSEPGIEPRSLDLQANSLPRHCKSKAVEVSSDSLP